MKGFDPKFKDFPDYIIGITREIWEERGISKLYDYYGQDISLRMPLGVYRGNEGVIAKTMGTLVEFPDRELLAEDVIWSGNEDDGMLSSHRVYCTGTHLGESMFGKAQGKPVVFRAIADCFAIANTITDEWLVRDYGGIARQLGSTAIDTAANLIAVEGGPDKCTPPLTPANDIEGPYKGRGNNNAWGQEYADYLNRIMNADFGVITDKYDRAVHGEYPGLVTARGWREVDTFWLALRSAFPSATFKIDHQIGREDPNTPPRAAIRWSLHGKHDGWGAFGRPTGTDVYIMGMSHAEFGPWGLRHEFTLYDEVAVWKQILMNSS